MKATITLATAFALTLAGCASGPYAGYGGYSSYDGYRPYAYDVPAYGYGYSYGNPYVYPGAIGGSLYYDRRDDDRSGRDRRAYRDRDYQQDRGRDRGNWRDRNDSPRSREPLDTRHGESGNEAGM